MISDQSPDTRGVQYQHCLDLVHQARAHLLEHPGVRDVEIMPSTLGEGISCRIWLRDQASSRPLPDGLNLDGLRLRIENLAACRGSVLATSQDTPRASLVWLF